MGKNLALGVGVAMALLLHPTLSMAQYAGPMDGPMEGSMGGPMEGVAGPYAYGPMPGRGPYYPGWRRQARAEKSHGSVAYHGYRIGLVSSHRTAAGAREARAVEHQLDIVERAGLSAADRRLFRSRLIHSSSYGGAGHTDGGQQVAIGRLAADDNRPVLLHEFMHVYHRNRLPGGFRNPAVLGFYEQAVASGAYPQGSYMLRNQKEFFAMTASAYLNGTVARPPYNRETIRQAQPDYYAYLARLFGPR